MLKWIKNLFRKTDTPLAEEPVIIKKATTSKTKVTPAEASKNAKTARKQKKVSPVVTKVNYDTMSKDELLAEAKKKKIKANASLKKDDLISRLKNAD